MRSRRAPPARARATAITMCAPNSTRNEKSQKMSSSVEDLVLEHHGERHDDDGDEQVAPGEVDRPRHRRAHAEVAAHEQRARQAEQGERDESGKLPEHGPDRDDDRHGDVEHDQTPCGQPSQRHSERHPIVVPELRHHEAVHEPRADGAPGGEQRRAGQHHRAEQHARASSCRTGSRPGSTRRCRAARAARTRRPRSPRSPAGAIGTRGTRCAPRGAQCPVSMVQVHASKSVAVRGRPPGPLYAMPYIGSCSNAIAGTLARAVCHASMSRSSAS